MWSISFNRIYAYATEQKWGKYTPRYIEPRVGYKKSLG